MSSVQGFYGRWARLYDALARHTPGIRSLRARAADALALSPGDAVVEMGCGTGANLPYLRERVGPEGTVVGVDLTRPMLDRAAALVGDAPNVHLVRADAARPPLDGPVDAVLGTFVVGMFDDSGAVVDGWCDLVRPGGRVVLVDAAPSPRSGVDARAVNALFRGVVALSTPPTFRLRYPDSPTDALAGRVEAARASLAARSTAVEEEERTLGVVRVTSGEVAPDDGRDSEG